MSQPSDDIQARNALSMPGAGRTETVMAVTHVYRLQEQDTDGALACLEVPVPPGHGLPPHTHYHEDETFYVVEGCLEFVGDDLPDAVLVPQGGVFYGRRGRVHGFRNPTDAPSRLLVVVTPGDNIQRMFAALATLTAEARGRPTPEDVHRLCAGYGVVFSPSPVPA